jgi:hypothetical protein
MSWQVMAKIKGSPSGSPAARRLLATRLLLKRRQYGGERPPLWK